VDEIDPATNRPKNEKALGSVAVFDNGKQVGPVWYEIISLKNYILYFLSINENITGIVRNY